MFNSDSDSAQQQQHHSKQGNRNWFVTVSAREFLRAPYRYGVLGVWVGFGIKI